MVKNNTQIDSIEYISNVLNVKLFKTFFIVLGIIMLFASFITSMCEFEGMFFAVIFSTFTSILFFICGFFFSKIVAWTIRKQFVVAKYNYEFNETNFIVNEIATTSKQETSSNATYKNEAIRNIKEKEKYYIVDAKFAKYAIDKNGFESNEDKEKFIEYMNKYKK